MSETIGRMLQIETPEAVTVTYPLAGLGSRGLAAVIDTTVLVALLIAEIVAVLAALALNARLFGATFDVVGPWGLAILVVLLFVTYWSYFIVGEVYRNGRTPGKRIMRIRVVRDDGSRVGVLDSIIRNIVRVVDILPGTYGVGIASSVFSIQAKRLGDMAAGTVVIADVPRRELPDTSTDERARLVGDFVGRRDSLTPEARWQVALALLDTYGERPYPGWTEPVVAGRLMDLAGLR